MRMNITINLTLEPIDVANDDDIWDDNPIEVAKETFDGFSENVLREILGDADWKVYWEKTPLPR